MEQPSFNEGDNPPLSHPTDSQNIPNIWVDALIYISKFSTEIRVYPTKSRGVVFGVVGGLGDG